MYKHISIDKKNTLLFQLTLGKSVVAFCLAQSIFSAFWKKKMFKPTNLDLAS